MPKPGTKMSPDQRAKISASMKGKRNALGHRVTPKQKTNLTRRWLMPRTP